MESWWWPKSPTLLITNLSSQQESNFTQNSPGPNASAVVLSVKPSPQELADIKGTLLIGQMVTSRHWLSVMFSSLISLPLFSLLQPCSSCWSSPCGCCCYGQKRQWLRVEVSAVFLTLLLVFRAQSRGPVMMSIMVTEHNRRWDEEKRDVHQHGCLAPKCSSHCFSSFFFLWFQLWVQEVELDVFKDAH